MLDVRGISACRSSPPSSSFFPPYSHLIPTLFPYPLIPFFPLSLVCPSARLPVCPSSRNFFSRYDKCLLANAGQPTNHAVLTEAGGGVAFHLREQLNTLESVSDFQELDSLMAHGHLNHVFVVGGEFSATDNYIQCCRNNMYTYSCTEK